MNTDFFVINPLESPFLLLLVALVDLVAMYLFVAPRLKGPAVIIIYLVPLTTLALAFGLDYFIVTDNEAITSIIYDIRDSFTDRMPAGIAPHIAGDYSDPCNADKARLMKRLEDLTKSLEPEKVRVNYIRSKITGSTAVVDAGVTIHINGSAEGIDFAGILLVDCEADMRKTNGKWQITSAKVLRINNSPPNW